MAADILDFSPPVADWIGATCDKAREAAINIANTAQQELRPPGTSRGDETRRLARPSVESQDPQVWANVCEFAYAGADPPRADRAP